MFELDLEFSNDNDEKGNNGGSAKEKGVQPTTDDPTYKYTDEKGEKVYIKWKRQWMRRWWSW